MPFCGQLAQWLNLSSPVRYNNGEQKSSKTRLQISAGRLFHVVISLVESWTSDLDFVLNFKFCDAQLEMSFEFEKKKLYRNGNFRYLANQNVTSKKSGRLTPSDFVHIL